MDELCGPGAADPGMPVPESQRARTGQKPTATSSHCGLPCEMNEDWPA